MITVFYDGKCRLCSKEINYYKSIAPIDSFNWQDISKSGYDLKKEGIPLAEGLKMLHVKDEKGIIHIGIDAFIIIWKELNYWRFLASFIKLPIVRQIANILYKYFASWRFKQLEHCQISLKQER